METGPRFKVSSERLDVMVHPLFWFIVLNFLFPLFRIVWWPSAAMDLSFWLSASLILSLVFSLISRWCLCLIEPRHDKTNKMSVRPAKTQISLDIRPVWSSLCAHLVAKDLSFLHADSGDSDQTGRMPRLIWVFAGRTSILLALSCRGSYVYVRLMCFLARLCPYHYNVDVLID